MTPRRLRLHGFRTLVDVDLDLPQGCVGVVGENGAGKSSLVMAIEIALFGPESRSLAPYVTVGAEDMEIELELEHAGERYRVRRTFSAKGRGKSALDFERALFSTREGYTDDQWAPLTLASAADTQALIGATIGLTRETWRASAYLAQGDGSAFTAAQPRDRKRILTDALGLQLWDALLELARVDRKTYEQRCQELAARTTLLQEQADRATEAERTVKTLALELEACEDDLSAATAETRSLEQRLEEAKTDAAAADARLAAVTTARKLHEAHVRLGHAAEQARPLIGPLLLEIASLEPKVRKLEELQAARLRLEAELHVAEQARQAAEAAVLRRNDLLGRASQLNEDAAELRVQAEILDLREHGEQTCDRCGQTLHDEARARASASYRADADRLDDQAAALDTEADTIAIPAVVHVDRDRLDETVAEILSLTNVPDELATARERLAGHERTIAQTNTDEYRAELDRLTVQLHDAETSYATVDPPQPGIVDTLTADLQDARRHAQTITDARERLRVDQARAQQVLDQASQARTRIAEHTAERARLADTLAELQLLERAFGRDGVPAHIVENTAIPTIEAEATRILRVLGGPVTAVELRTQRELKTGGLADSLDVVCLTDDSERDYSTFSGGERTRVDLALRIALARLLAHRRGAESRLLAIDEPDGLDTDGMAALVDVLRDLEQNKEFDSLILVSHIPALRDAFDTTLTVERGEAGSVVTVG